jgi:hypothetical protein
LSGAAFAAAEDYKRLKSILMADTLYLSLWYPNLRLETLPDKLIAVLGAFAAHGGEAKVYSATVWPVSWNESPVFERIYGRMVGEQMDGGRLLAGPVPGQLPGADPRVAVAEATELLHEDYAYEFQIGWNLWELEIGAAGSLSAEDEEAGLHSTLPADAGFVQGRLSTRRPVAAGLAQDDSEEIGAQDDNLKIDARDDDRKAGARDDGYLGQWARGPRLVRVTGYGPLFDEGTYEQDGHIRIDFGSDAPFLEEDVDLSEVGGRHVEENVRQLVELTAGVEKASGATARLLWSELGESLAQRLAARLGMGN